MGQSQEALNQAKDMWRKASLQLLICIMGIAVGMVISNEYGNVRNGAVDQKIIAAAGVVTFLFFSILFLQIATTTFTGLLSVFHDQHLTAGRRAALRFFIQVIGYVVIFLVTLELLDVPIANLLIGGATIGIILGVAAQQALANFFASIVLIISHPFSVGDLVTFNSGALGGKYTGTVKDIGLTHTRLVDAKGVLVLLPNSALLSGSTVTIEKNIDP